MKHRNFFACFSFHKRKLTMHLFIAINCYKLFIRLVLSFNMGYMTSDYETVNYLLSAFSVSRVDFFFTKILSHIYYTNIFVCLSVTFPSLSLSIYTPLYLYIYLLFSGYQSDICYWHLKRFSKHLTTTIFLLDIY